MKFFLRSPADAMFAINRCYFEADHGHANLAVARLQDLADEIPDNARIQYAEGIIRRDYLGQGLVGRDLFEKSFELAVQGRLRKKTGYLAAYCAAELARDEKEYRLWADRAVSSCPFHLRSERRHFSERIDMLDRGTPYRDILIGHTVVHENRNEHGPAAAALEVFLQTGMVSGQDRLGFLMARSTRHLRELDRRDEYLRKQSLEAFPPDERLALQAAMLDLERALSLDEFDATLWNFKSSWCISLERYEEGIKAADRAIALRPHNYPRPHLNKASCLYMLDRQPEALAAAQEALRQARELHDPEQEEQAKLAAQDYSTPRPKPSLESMVPGILQRVQLVALLSREELAQLKWGSFSIKSIANQVLSFAHTRLGQPSLAYVPMMAQLLGDFTPETAIGALLVASSRDTRVGDHCCRAILYLAAHSQGVQQRDAARLLALMILTIPNADAIRLFYRQHILETAAAATGALTKLDAIARDSILRIQPQLPSRIADQDRVDETGRSRARRSILSQLDGPRPDPIRSSRVMGLLARVFPSLF